MTELAPLAMAAKPGNSNILMLFADDLGRQASAYADAGMPSPNQVIRTPGFERVATEGARFDNAFVSSPSCTPSCSALYTGRLIPLPAAVGRGRDAGSRGCARPRFLAT